MKAAQKRETELKTGSSNSVASVPGDTWIPMAWDDYLQVIEDPAYEKASGYYFDGRARIEMTPLGNDHASDHLIIGYAIQLYASLKQIELNGKDNCSYRRAGYQEVQPDLSFYSGDNLNAVPHGTKVVSLDKFPPPNLVVEVADSSLSDDKGEKRILYESLNVQEYWIVDVRNTQIVAFAVENGGSRQIRESGLLAGLEFSVLEEGLRRTRESSHTQVGAWLLREFQGE
jgi:Uma2 family endonuclease